MRLDRLAHVAGQRVAGRVDGVPQAGEDDTRVPDAHGPADALDRGFADAAARGGVAAVDEGAVVVVVAGEGVADVADFAGDVGADFLVHDVLVLVPAADGDGVAFVVLEGSGLARGRW